MPNMPVFEWYWICETILTNNKYLFTFFFKTTYCDFLHMVSIKVLVSTMTNNNANPIYLILSLIQNDQHIKIILWTICLCNKEVNNTWGNISICTCTSNKHKLPFLMNKYMGSINWEICSAKFLTLFYTLANQLGRGITLTREMVSGVILW